MFRSTVATAVLMVGQILEILFGFTVTLANHRAFETISPKLRLRSHILVRLIVPILIYIPVSLSFATLSLPFNLPFGARYNTARVSSYIGVSYIWVCSGLALHQKL